MDPDGAKSQKRIRPQYKASGPLFKKKSILLFAFQKKGILLFVLFAFKKRKASYYLLLIKQPCIIRLPLLKKMPHVGILHLFKVTPSHLRETREEREKEKQERENPKKNGMRNFPSGSRVLL